MDTIKPKKKLKKIAKIFLPDGCEIVDWQFDMSGDTNSIFADVIHPNGLKYIVQISCKTIQE